MCARTFAAAAAAPRGKKETYKSFFFLSPPNARPLPCRRARARHPRSPPTAAVFLLERSSAIQGAAVEALPAEAYDGMAGEQEAALRTPPGPSPGWPSTRSADVDTPPPAAARTPSGTSQPTTSPGTPPRSAAARTPPSTPSPGAPPGTPPGTPPLCFGACGTPPVIYGVCTPVLSPYNEYLFRLGLAGIGTMRCQKRPLHRPWDPPDPPVSWKRPRGETD